VKNTDRVGLDAKTMHRMAADPPGFQLTARPQRWKQAQDLPQAEVLEKNEIELAIVDLCVWREAKPGSVARGIQHTSQQSFLHVKWSVASVGGDGRADRAEASQRAHGRKKISQTPAQIAIGSAGETGGFRIETHSPSPGIQPFIPFRGANADSIERTHLTPKQKLGCTQGLLWQTQRSGQVIPAASWNNAENRLREVLHGVQQDLEGAVAPNRENAFSSGAGCLRGLLCKIPGVFSWNQINSPTPFPREPFEISEDFTGPAAARSRIDEQEIAVSQRGQGGMGNRKWDWQMDLQTGETMVPAGGIEPTA
jgi:hypothetical protein